MVCDLSYTCMYACYVLRMAGRGRGRINLTPAELTEMINAQVAAAMAAHNPIGAGKEIHPKTLRTHIVVCLIQ